MKNGLKFILTTVLLCLSLATFAQENSPEMADALRQDGKFWVVVVVMTVIFAGLGLYLLILDRKISRLERNR